MPRLTTTDCGNPASGRRATRRRLALGLTVVLVLTCVTVALRSGSEPASTGPKDLPLTTIKESDGLRYDAEFTTGRLLLGDRDVVLLPLGLDLPRGGDVRLAEVEAASVHGLELDTPIIVMASGMMFPERGYPPRRREWTSAPKAAIGDTVLSVGQQRVMTVVGRGQVTAEQAYVKGFWVEGTQDGKEFRDFVAGYVTFCAGRRETQPCREFTDENSFAADRDAAQVS